MPEAARRAGRRRQVRDFLPRDAHHGGDDELCDAHAAGDAEHVAAKVDQRNADFAAGISTSSATAAWRSMPAAPAVWYSGRGRPADAGSLRIWTASALVTREF